MSPAEQRARIDLAAAYRLVAHFGWDDLVSTHISARIPGSHGELLLNPLGTLFHEITASCLVKIDLEGNVIAPVGAAINRAAFTIHSAVHGARPELGAVIHLHGKFGTAVSMTRDGLLPLSQKALALQQRLAYHDYEGIAFDLGERERLIRDLGDKQAMLLRNHGTLAVGDTVAEAFMAIYQLETACEMQILAQSTGCALVTPSREAAAKVATQTRASFLRDLGDSAWPGLLRMLDARDVTYRT